MAQYTKEAAIIGTAAGISGLCTWPIEAAKNARQLGRDYSFYQQCTSNGFFSAYRGVGPYASYKIFGIGVQRGVQAPLVDFFRSHSIPDLPNYAMAGLISGVIGGAIVTVPEQLKLSLFNQDILNVREGVLRFHRVGLRRLYGGLRITILRNAAFDSINASLYYSGLATGHIDTKNPISMMLFNQFCGVTTAILDYPLDIIKTRIQIATFSDAAKGIQTPGILETAKIIVKTSGARGLYAGLERKLFLYFSVWGAYGGTKALLDQHFA